MLLSACRPIRPVVWILLLCVGGFLLGGCDGAGSKQASLYERLTGTWTIERLKGGGFDYTNQLNGRYPRGVNITFEDGDGGRTYRIVSPLSGDSTEVLAEGIVILISDDVLQMTSGFGQLGPVTWTYGFEASRAIFTLRSNSRAFLSTLFSGMSQDENLRMTLAPDEE